MWGVGKEESMKSMRRKRRKVEKEREGTKKWDKAEMSLIINKLINNNNK